MKQINEGGTSSPGPSPGPDLEAAATAQRSTRAGVCEQNNSSGEEDAKMAFGAPNQVLPLGCRAEACRDGIISFRRHHPRCTQTPNCTRTLNQQRGAFSGRLAAALRAPAQALDRLSWAGQVLVLLKGSY